MHAIGARRAVRNLGRKGYGTDYGDLVRGANALLPESARRSHIVETSYLEFVGVLDLEKQPKSTLRQLTRLDERALVSKAKTIVVDLRKVKEIEPGAMLVLASRIERLSRNVSIEVCGFWPSEKKLRSVLVDAGFDKFLGLKRPDNKSGNVELIIGGYRKKLENSQFAKRIKELLMTRHPQLSRYESDSIGLAVNELLENVDVHAFDDDETRSWCAVGVFDADSKTSTVSILDFGKGVSATVRGQVNKRILNLLVNEADDVKEAIMGLRTRTGERHRGKGFGEMRDFVENAGGRRMSVVSGRGLVQWTSKGFGSALRVPRLWGTVVTLTVQNSARED